jgi:hypothetical protein
MNRPEKQTGTDTRFEPGMPISALDAEARFGGDEFYKHLTAEFNVTEKAYQPLKQWLKGYDIDAQDILGSEYPEELGVPPREDLVHFEQAKLTVLARRMSKRSKKWLSYVTFSTPSMSTALGSKAPSSKLHKKNRDEMVQYYLDELKAGIPCSALDSAKPLLDDSINCELPGGRFEQRSILMTKAVSDFLAGRQRERLVENNRKHGWRDPVKGFAFWPAHVLPDFGATEAVEVAKKGFVGMLDAVPPEASKDMARVRLLKDYFLDAETSHWREAYELNKCLLEDLPVEICRLDLYAPTSEILANVAQAFNVEVCDLPVDLLGLAQCLVRIYGLKHCPDTDMASLGRQKYFEGLHVAHQTAMAAALLFSMQRASRQLTLTLPGETHSKVSVHKAFVSALAACEVDLKDSLDANNQKLVSVLETMDTKVLTYLTSLFSVASMGDDGQSRHLRMEYLASQLNVKISRTALLAELPQMLKPYSCRLANQLMGDFMSVLKEVTYNPLA